MKLNSLTLPKAPFCTGLLLLCAFLLTGCKFNKMSQVWSPLSTPSKSEQNAIDCFIEIGLTPGETSKEQVLELWGKPSNVNLPDSDFWWSYQSLWTPRVVFDAEKVEHVTFFLEKCTLGEVIQSFGPPEVVEFTALISCIGAPTIYDTKFHYPELGIAFQIICEPGLSEQQCKSYKPDSQIDIKEFYKQGKVIKDSTGFNMQSVVFPWPGFNKSDKK